MTALSMYERALGDDYARLAVAVQRFHRLVGRQVLQGHVETHAPASLPARLLALCLGTPREAGSGPIEFELDADAEVETWIRRFPTRTMSSRLRLASGRVVEHLGVARLTFELQEVGGRLRMGLRSLHVMGISCPNWLLPRVVAEETGHGDQLHFSVQAALPFIGVIASYRGHLVVPGKEQM